MVTEIKISDYLYPLPDDRIAKHPLPDRDQSKLLVYQAGSISHNTFRDLPAFLPAHALLFFNNTKVIPARLHFTKDTGAVIEIFLLQPLTPSPVLATAMQAQGTATWKCTIGNLKRWPDGMTLKHPFADGLLRAQLIDRGEGIVSFSWGGSADFASIIRQSGETPLPPYLHRAPEAADRERYQTVYAAREGAVAAPTAGLHFTPEVLAALTSKGVQADFLTLHVSAGTFQPVKTENALEHVMHREQVCITRSNLEMLLQPEKFVVAVGTTSMRTLESLYWFGVKLSTDPGAAFQISQTEAYTQQGPLPTKQDALQRVAELMDTNNLDTLVGDTAIYITPGYSFKVCQGLITNFHQPGSTLMLLVAAFAGPDWKTIYREALDNNYRFLSYGDSSLLLPRDGDAL